MSKPKYRKCQCGNRFMPRMGKQRHCLYCILDAKPNKPKIADFTDYCNGTTEFDEWVIYSWYNIQRNLAKMKGVPFVYYDGVVDVGGVVK